MHRQGLWIFFHPRLFRIETVLFLSAAYSLAAGAFTGQADFILSLRPAGRSEQEFMLLARELRLDVKYFSARHGVAAVRFPLGMSRRSAADLLSADHRIARAEPDFPVRIAAFFPGDSLFPRQWSLYNPGGNRADVKAPEAWAMERGRSSVVIAILDTGIDYFHPDLKGNIWRNPGEVAGNGRDDDGNGYVDDVHGWDFAQGDSEPMDGHYHGTLMAGIAGARAGNRIGICGVMHEVSLMAVKGLGDKGYGYSSDLIAGIYYAVDNGAMVINASWGGAGRLGAMRDAIAYARDHGVIFVAAAGNRGRDNDREPFYPASYDLDNVISVAATDSRDSLAQFSNIGATSVDIAAPGVGVIGTSPGGRYLTTSGTSMAAPHVAGCVGLLASYAPGLTYREYIECVLRPAHPLRHLAGLCTSGGRLDMHQALKWSLAKRRDVKVALSYMRYMKTAY